MNIQKYIRETRKFGHTYIHASIRREFFSFIGIPVEVDGRKARLTWAGFGRSLQVGGHKYKAHLNWEDNGRPVPSKLIGKIQRITQCFGEEDAR
jgi:hypothetical protein